MIDGPRRRHIMIIQILAVLLPHRIIEAWPGHIAAEPNWKSLRETALT